MYDNFRVKLGFALVLAFAATALLLPAGASARCTGGGLSPAEIDICTPTAKAKLLANGMLVPPASAPPRVKAVIAAANQIRSKPYIYGGGHARWWDRGYDCSGSVSYALHGGGLLKRAMDSTEFESYGVAGPGQWITVYGNSGHAYMVVAGLRFDTSGLRTRGTRWTGRMRSPRGYTGRHPAGL